MNRIKIKSIFALVILVFLTQEKISNTAEQFQVNNRLMDIGFGTDPKNVMYLPLKNDETLYSFNSDRIWVYDEQTIGFLCSEKNNLGQYEFIFKIAINGVETKAFNLGIERPSDIVWNDKGDKFCVLQKQGGPELKNCSYSFKVYAVKDGIQMDYFSLLIPNIRGIVRFDENFFYFGSLRASRNYPRDSKFKYTTDIYQYNIQTKELKIIYTCDDSVSCPILKGDGCLYVVEYDRNDKVNKQFFKGKVSSIDLKDFSTKVIDQWDNENRTEFLIDHKRMRLGFREIDAEGRGLAFNVFDIHNSTTISYSNLKDFRQPLYFDMENNCFIGIRQITEMMSDDKNYNIDRIIKTVMK